MYTVSRGESLCSVALVFMNSTDQVICNSDIQGSGLLARKDIYVILLWHFLSVIQAVSDTVLNFLSFPRKRESIPSHLSLLHLDSRACGRGVTEKFMLKETCSFRLPVDSSDNVSLIPN